MTRTNLPAAIFLVLSLFGLSLGAEPTEMRSWRSTAGTSVEASATKVADGKVFLTTSGGKNLSVPMDKFTEEDRKFLADHFDIKEPEPGQPTASAAKLIEDGLSHPVGQVSGPIDAGGGSHYYVYIPKSLREGRPAPLMLHTGAGGGNANAAKMYAKGAEISGWIMASCVESKNGTSFEENHAHSKRCVEHLLANLPIDPERVYFTGGSGGGAMSFYNALRIKSAGNMPLIGYSNDRKYDKKQYCYGIGGTGDYNRYLTANAATQFGDRGFHRLTPGGHSGGPAWLGDEGVVWLNGRYLGDRARDSDLAEERLDFEAALIGWAQELADTEPHRAHYWCTFLKDEYGISGTNAAPVSELLSKLSGEPNNARYTEGLAEINEFSAKYYAPLGENGGSARKHTDPKIQRAAEKLAAEFAGVPLIEEIAKRLGETTG